MEQYKGKTNQEALFTKCLSLKRFGQHPGDFVSLCENQVCVHLAHTNWWEGTNLHIVCCPRDVFSVLAGTENIWRAFPNPLTETGIAQGEIVHSSKCSFVSCCTETGTLTTPLLCICVVGIVKSVDLCLLKKNLLWLKPNESLIQLNQSWKFGWKWPYRKCHNAAFIYFYIENLMHTVTALFVISTLYSIIFSG
jgi:hypothetical protein